MQGWVLFLVAAVAVMAVLGIVLMTQSSTINKLRQDAAAHQARGTGKPVMFSQESPEQSEWVDEPISGANAAANDPHHPSALGVEYAFKQSGRLHEVKCATDVRTGLVHCRVSMDPEQANQFLQSTVKPQQAQPQKQPPSNDGFTTLSAKDQGGSTSKKHPSNKSNISDDRFNWE